MSGRIMPSLEPPRGMRDFYPEEMRLRNHIFSAWREAAVAFGFEPYDACVVESLELLQRKSGEEVSAQIYHFQDKSGRNLALRPEMTPTLARMVAARSGALPFPLKWTTVAQCFRYERMTRGRKREHYQWNLDIVGSQEVGAELEVIAAADSAIMRMGLPADAYRVRVNNRALLTELLQRSGIENAHHNAVFLALDKRGKINDSEIATLLRGEGLDQEAIDKTFGLLEVETLEQAAQMAGTDSPAVTRLRELFTLAECYGIAERLVFDISVIRGLAYYTDIVFEAFDAERRFRAIFGGGRYDSLLSSIGGPPTPAVGMGFGDVVIAEILKELPDVQLGMVSEGITVGYMQPEQRVYAAKVATMLRGQGEQVDLMLAPQKPRQFFSRAGGRASSAIYIGPDDVASGTVRRKNLVTRGESVITLPQ